MVSSIQVLFSSVNAAGCNTTYRPNYYVQQASLPGAVRHYYGGIPAAIEVAEHAYIDRDLMKLIRAQMTFAQYVIPFSIASSHYI